MSNTKTVMSQAANTQGLPLDITDVFSTYLYTGNGTSNRKITTNINTSDEGGMVWIKNRDGGDPHVLFDTERGSNKSLTSNTTDAEVTDYQRLTSFRDDGFIISTDPEVNASNGDNYASWTFRKAPKFFDVVTYTGDGVAGRTVAHNLGTTVGSIFVKCTSNSFDWAVYHRGVDATAPEDYFLYLNSTDSRTNTALVWNDTAPTDSAFTLGTAPLVNASGATYVAYLFAHNDGDGGFGPSGDQDIIKCGSYTGNGSTGQYIDIGFEPQWLLVKSASGTSNWTLVDNMRGMNSLSTGNLASSNRLVPSASSAEGVIADFAPTPTGWYTGLRGDADSNANGQTYIYIAIRRGTKVPESATEVFDVEQGSSSVADPAFTTGFPVDLMIQKDIGGGDGYIASRLTGSTYLKPNNTNAETSAAAYTFDWSDGFQDSNSNANRYAWMWKRAPKFFDVVAYTGDGSTVNINHNLGVSPEMIWVKRRNSSDQYAAFWSVYHKDLGYDKVLKLNDTVTPLTYSGYWGSGHTDTTFGVSTSFNPVNTSGNTYIAYLFASLAGISKVGSYTGNGTSQTIGCGFTSGARFILIKRTDSTGDWYVWDTERGIVTGNDPHLSLNTTAAEVTSDDSIDPDSSGFIVNQVAATNINVSSTEYIFYAVA